MSNAKLWSSLKQPCISGTALSCNHDKIRPFTLKRAKGFKRKGFKEERMQEERIQGRKDVGGKDSNREGCLLPMKIPSLTLVKRVAHESQRRMTKFAGIP